MKTRIIYISDYDGTEFNSEEECISYDKSKKNIKECLNKAQEEISNILEKYNCELWYNPDYISDKTVFRTCIRSDYGVCEFSDSTI